MKNFIRLRMRNKELVWYDFLDENEIKDPDARTPLSDDEEVFIVEYKLFLKTRYAADLFKRDLEELLDDSSQ